MLTNPAVIILLFLFFFPFQIQGQKRNSAHWWNWAIQTYTLLRDEPQEHDDSIVVIFLVEHTNGISPAHLGHSGPILGPSV